MGFPKLKRVNTVGIRFTKGDKDDSHYLYFTYSRLVKDFEGMTIRLDDDTEFVVDDLSTYKNRVRVTKVPFEMDDASLRTLLERYGKVENINTSLKKFGDYTDMLSDERIVWMVVEFPIPSSLYITDSETYIYFSYLQQPKTCHKCGSDEHMVSQCDVYRNTRPKDRENAVDLDPDETSVPNRNRPESESSSSSSDAGSGDEFEDSKSGLSADSDADNAATAVLLANLSQIVQGNTPNEGQNENQFADSEYDNTSRSDPNQDPHTSNHTGEIVETRVSTQNLISEIVESPNNSSTTQIPIPRARSSLFSSSQPATLSSVNNNKRRNLSLSPQHTSEYLSKPKITKIVGVQFV